MAKLSEMRCSNCKKMLAEFDFPKGQLRVLCQRTHCRTMNIIVIKERENGEPEFSEIKLPQYRKNAL